MYLCSARPPVWLLNLWLRTLIPSWLDEMILANMITSITKDLLLSFFSASKMKQIAKFWRIRMKKNVSSMVVFNSDRDILFAINFSVSCAWFKPLLLIYILYSNDYLRILTCWLFLISQILIFPRLSRHLLS